jgi:hypothetical protein
VNLGRAQYEAAAELPVGRHEFKVAASDWTPEFTRIDQDTVLGVPITLASASGAGSNSHIDIATAGCYTFALNAASPSNPVLTVTARSVGLEPDVLAFARTMSNEKNVVVVLNNQRAAVDLATLAGGGIDVQGLIADGALVEITGACHNLQVSGGRLLGAVPALTALGVAAP